MANVRIKDLTTTAATTASDDFFGVDGATNGTRKLSAFSPTFGGNLTVTGTGAFGDASGGVFYQASLNSNNQGTGVRLLNNNAGSRNWYIGSQNNVGNAVEITPSTANNGTTFSTPVWQVSSGGNVTQTGNLTVSGTGTSSVAGKLAVGTTAVIGNSQFTLKKATNKNLNIDAAAGAVSGISIYAGTDADAYTGLQVDGDKLYLNARSGGNVLIGTTIDGGQKLQVSGTAYVSGDATFAGNGTFNSLLTAKNAAGSVAFDVQPAAGGSAFRITPQSGATGAQFEAYSTVSGFVPLNMYASAYTFNTGNATFAGKVTVGTDVAFPAGGYGLLFGSTRIVEVVSDGINIVGSRIRISTDSTPASASATGIKGDIKWDADYIYVCTATNIWKRVAIATWP